MTTEEFNQNNGFNEEESSFDFKEWLFHFLRYWYLFAIGIFVALGASYLKNRSWLPSYQTAATMILENSNTGSRNASFMQGFGVQAGYRNLNNQVIMLQSYDLLTRVVDSLPFMKVDYISQGRFKIRNVYKNTPIYIQPEAISPEAYKLLFKVELLPEGKYNITVDSEDKRYSDFKITGVSGEPIKNSLFTITLNDLRPQPTPSEIYFRFRTTESLVNEFYYRLQFAYVTEGSSILRVTLNSQTPERDIDFIDKLCDVFISDNLNLKNEAAIKTINFIDEQLTILSQSLGVSEGRMTQFRQENKIVDVSSYVSGILSRVTQYDNKKRELEMREVYLNYLVEYLQNNLEVGSVVAPSSLGLNEPMLMSLVNQINQKYIERSELSTKNFYYDRISQEIETIKEAIFEVTSSMRLTLNIEKNEVDRRLKEIDEEIKILPGKELEMISIERNYRVDDNYYTFFLQKKAEAEIQKTSNSSDNSVLDRARIMAVTNSGAKSKTMTTYLFIGLLIPAAFVLLIKLLNSKINSEKEIEKYSSFPLIGSIRRTKSKDPMLAIKKPRSSFAEMFRVIRTRIEFIVQRKDNIMITVTSAESGDGKTYFSANLAAVYAMTERKTLLVDLDIRKPNVYELFNISNEPGITNYLIGDKKLADVIKKTENKSYDILTVGAVPPNPGEIVRSDNLKQLFEELKNIYDYVIVDTSPIGLVADAYSIALMSDVNLFVTRMGKTNKQHLKKNNIPVKG